MEPAKFFFSPIFFNTQLWDAREREAVKTIAHDFQVTSCCFNEDSTQIITGGLDGIIRVVFWNSTNHRYSKQTRSRPRSCFLSSLRWLPAFDWLPMEAICKILSTFGIPRMSHSLDACLRVWDINAYFEGSNRCLKLMRGHTVGWNGEKRVMNSRETVETCCDAHGVRI